MVKRKQLLSYTSDYLVFEDSAMGYTIGYPRNWAVVAPNVEYGLSGFRSPDNSAFVTVKLIPTGGQSLTEFGEEITDSEFIQLTEFCRPSTV